MKFAVILTNNYKPFEHKHRATVEGLRTKLKSFKMKALNVAHILFLRVNNKNACYIHVFIINSKR